MSVVVTDSDRIRSILTTLSATRALGTVRAIRYRNGFEHWSDPEPVELVEGPRLLVSAEFCAAVDAYSWQVELPGPYSLVRFRIESWQRMEHGRFDVPMVLECTYRRTERRANTPPGAKIRFLRNGSYDLWLERPLRNVSFSGLQFVTKPDDSFYPGEVLCAAHLTWKHGPRLPISAVVRHVNEAIGTEEGSCGVSIKLDESVPARHWHDELSSLLHPNTMDGSDLLPEQLWELYDVSGYFALAGQDPEEFAPLKQAFAVSKQKLSSAPHLACQVTCRHRGRVDATISLLRCWSGAWLAYQIARRRDDSPLALSGNSVLRDIFLDAYETVQQNPSLKWHVTYVRFDARFSRLAYYDFAESRIDDREVSIVPFRAMQVPSTYGALARDPAFEVGRATSDERSRVLARLATEFPRPYLEAYDFVPTRFELTETQDAWNGAGLMRERALLVARYAGVPVAAAIVDLVEPGAHLVGLLDSAHLVSLRKDGHLHFERLLAFVQDWYSRRGRQHFVLFEETGNPTYAFARGAKDLGEANQIFVAASLTPEFLDHICFVTAPR